MRVLALGINVLQGLLWIFAIGMVLKDAIQDGIKEGQRKIDLM